MVQIRLFYGEDPTGRGFYWPSSEQKRAELMSVKRLRQGEYQSVYQCNPGAREGGIFLESDFVGYRPPVGLEEGISNPNVRAFCAKGHAIFQAWDTAWDAAEANDPSCCITGLLVPCDIYHRGETEAEFGPCDPHFDILLLDLYLEKLTYAELGNAFRRQWVKWLPEAGIIEKKQSGIGLFQSMQATHRLIGVTPQDSKRARVVQGAGAGTVQSWFRLHRVAHPIGAHWIRNYKREMKDFTGDKSGKDDQVDTTAHLVQHAIDLGSMAALLPTEWTPERVNEFMAMSRVMAPISQAGAAPSDPAELLGWISALQGMSVNPFSDVCSSCTQYPAKGEKPLGYCRVQARNVIALDSCGEFAPRAAA